MIPSRHRSLPLLLGLLATPLASLLPIDQSAAASGFLPHLEGKWKGRGTIETLGEDAKKDPLACRLKASYDESGNTLNLSGRCGSVSVTSSFETSLTRGSDGTITGMPILQRGDFAKIALSGKSNSDSLRLTGQKQDNALTTSFILTGEDSFQTQSGSSIAGRDTNRVIIDWQRQ